MAQVFQVMKALNRMVMNLNYQMLRSLSFRKLTSFTDGPSTTNMADVRTNALRQHIASLPVAVIKWLAGLGFAFGFFPPSPVFITVQSDTFLINKVSSTAFVIRS